MIKIVQGGALPPAVKGGTHEGIGPMSDSNSTSHMRVGPGPKPDLHHPPAPLPLSTLGLPEPLHGLRQAPLPLSLSPSLL